MVFIVIYATIFKSVESDVQLLFLVVTENEYIWLQYYVVYGILCVKEAVKMKPLSVINGVYVIKVLSK